MSTKNAVAPVEKKRADLLRDMTPAGREIAKEFEKKLGQGARGIVLIQYDLGAQLVNVIEHEADYGSNFVGQLADYLGIAGGETMLYALRNFADSFERKFVETETLAPLTDGTYLELGHWIKLTQLKEHSDVKKYLKRIREESLSVRALSREVAAANSKLKHTRQGGRKPGVPTSPIAGLQQTFSMAQKFANWEPVLEQSVCEPIEHMSAELVSDDLLTKLKMTHDKLLLMGKSTDKSIKYLERNIARVERILAARPKEEKPAKKAAPKAEKKAKPKPKKAVGKKAAKAKAQGKKKAKAPKKKRQIAVVE